MVRHFIAKLTAPVRGLHQAAYLLAGLTLVAQILSLLRDRLFAYQFGAGQVLDVYYAAFKIPDVVFALIASLVSAYVLIPRIAGVTSTEGKLAARKLISETATFLLIVGGLISFGIAVAAPYLLPLLFPDLMRSEYAPQFVLLTRILLAQPIVLGLSGVLGSVVQLNRRFFLFALSPILYNLGIIFGAIALYPKFGIVGIGYGVVIGALLHLAVNIPVLWRAGLMPRLCVPEITVLWGVMKNSVPRSLALGMGSLTTLLLIALASRTGSGGVAVFTLAGNLSAVPLSLIGAAYATAAFPVLAEQIGSSKFDAFKTTLTVALRHIIFWSSVITVLTVVLRAYLVRVILGAGAFDWNDTRLTAAILAVLIVGLLAQGMTLIASRAFYAANRSWNPLMIQILGVCVSVAGAALALWLAATFPMVDYFMEALLRIEDVPGSRVLYIAMGAAIGQLAMGALALVTLQRVAAGVARSLMRPLFEGLGAAILGGAASYGVLAFTGTLAPLTRLATVFTEGAIAGMVGLAVAGAVLALLENQEFKDLRASLRKITSTKSLAPYAPIHDRQDT